MKRNQAIIDIENQALYSIAMEMLEKGHTHSEVTRVIDAGLASIYRKDRWAA